MAAPPISSEDLELVLNGTRNLWEEMRGQRLFITGGTGFFGCWLVESFCYINAALDLGAEAIVLSRDTQAFQNKMPHVTSNPAVTLLQGDMRDFTFPPGEVRFVIHAATDTYAKHARADSIETFSAILAGTKRALKFAATHGTRKFLLTSSGAAYGPQPPGMTHVPETYLGQADTLDPRSMYAEAKRASELMCALYREIAAFECKIARCWSFCGPHLPLGAHYAIGNFIADAMAQRTIRITGDGTARRSYLYAADLTVWLWTMLFGAPALVPFNIGSSHDLSIYELAQVVVKSLCASSSIHLAKQATPGAEASRYVPSVDRAAKMLHLNPTVSLEEAIRRTAAWYRRAE